MRIPHPFGAAAAVLLLALPRMRIRSRAARACLGCNAYDSTANLLPPVESIRRALTITW